MVRIPHFTSVIHWILRVGIAIFNQVSTITEPWVAIIDCSIDIGTRKALVVLRVPLSALQNAYSDEADSHSDLMAIVIPG